MLKKKYFDSKQINESIELKTENGITFNIVTIDGVIYRGDHQKNPKIRNLPTFFGSYDAASLYLRNGYYIKHYNTTKPLYLLCLNNTIDNIQIIKKIFTDSPLFNQINRKILTITYILLQLFYGLIDGSFAQLDLCGETYISILKFMENDMFRKYHLDPMDKKVLETLINLKSNNSLVPSRVSKWAFDNIIMILLRNIFSKYGIDGVWASSRNYTEEEQKKLVCMKINKFIFNSDDDKPTCAPSDLALFKSKGNVTLFRMERYLNRQYINIPINQKHYEKKYHHYKKKYHKHKKPNGLQSL